MKEVEGARLGLALLLGLAAACANVAGGLVILRRKWPRRWLHYFVAVGAGFMLATAILEMVPESLVLRPDPARVCGLVLAGYLMVHFFEHTVARHFHFGEETHTEEVGHSHSRYTALVGLIFHTLFDGVAIASGMLVSRWLGLIIFLAVFLHKFPEGFTVSSLMLASGESRRAAFTAAALLGGATMAGVILMYLFGGAVTTALPFSAGVTLYVAATDLLPEVNREPSTAMALAVFLGASMMLLLKHLANV
jgi:zinc and cadmium transporter